MQPQGPTWYVWAGGVAWQSCVASLAGPGSWYLVLNALYASSLGLELAAERLEGACCLEGDLLVVAAQTNNSNKKQTENSRWPRNRANGSLKRCSRTPPPSPAIMPTLPRVWSSGCLQNHCWPLMSEPSLGLHVGSTALSSLAIFVTQDAVWLFQLFLSKQHTSLHNVVC